MCESGFVGEIILLRSRKRQGEDVKIERGTGQGETVNNGNCDALNG